MANRTAVDGEAQASWQARSKLARVVGQRTIDAVVIGLLVLTAWRLILVTDQAATNQPSFDLDRPAARVGSRVFDAGVLAASSRNVVLAVSSTCPVCQNSLGLYRALSAFAEEQPEWDLVVLGKQNQQWIRDANIEARFIDDPQQVSIWATPTLMVVNSEGIITDILVGFVKAQVEATLWDRLDGVQTTPPLDNSVIPRRVTHSEFGAARNSADGFQLVDFRQRSPNIVPHPDAIQIPLAEVSRRSREVLSRGRPVLLDCSVPGISEAGCLVAAIPFHEAGFQDISMLVNDGTRGRR